MAYSCHFCEKKPVYGNNVSHANNKTRRRWMPNLKKIRIKAKGVVQSVRLCTRCIRTGNYIKAA